MEQFSAFIHSPKACVSFWGEKNVLYAGVWKENALFGVCHHVFARCYFHVTLTLANRYFPK